VPELGLIILLVLEEQETKIGLTSG